MGGRERRSMDDDDRDSSIQVTEPSSHDLSRPVHCCRVTVTTMNSAV
jgi:hypothetical protein